MCLRSYLHQCVNQARFACRRGTKEKRKTELFVVEVENMEVTFKLKSKNETLLGEKICKLQQYMCSNDLIHFF